MVERVSGVEVEGESVVFVDGERAGWDLFDINSYVAERRCTWAVGSRTT